MNREFLKSLGIEDEKIEKIMTEHGKSIKADKESQDELATVKQEKEELQKQLNNLNTEKDGLSTKLASLEAERDGLNKSVTDLQFKDLKRNIAFKNNIPFDLADRLVGEDEASLQTDAERLASYMSPKTPAAPLKDYETTVVDNETQAYKNLVNNLEVQN